eukprot:2448481-Pleurochrysis_carterae.AAC.3
MGHKSAVYKPQECCVWATRVLRMSLERPCREADAVHHVAGGREGEGGDPRHPFEAAHVRRTQVSESIGNAYPCHVTFATLAFTSSALPRK